MEKHKVGLGFDVHRFSEDKRDLVLGGVIVPHSRGLEAVSDGDVVLHAVSDALCGACGLGDIGDYFPPAAAESKGIDSKDIVKFILKKIDKEFTINNMDVIIIAEEPYLFPHKKDILESLKNIFSISGINLKVKSKEGMDILGGKNSISCLVNVLVKFED